MARSSSHSGRHSRDSLLQAGIEEFSRRGVSGARTETIAAQAGVNKALLHYYFESKDGLYKAVLQTVFAGVLEQSFAILQDATSPGERLLRWHLQHFDRMVASREYQGLLQQEMMRARQGKTEILQLLAAKFFRPLHKKLIAVIEQGIAEGELNPMEPLQIVYSIFGTNAAYFSSAPMMRIAASFEPLAPASLKKRRHASLTFLSLAIFVDRDRGSEIVKRILAETPMPNVAKVHNTRSKDV